MKDGRPVAEQSMRLDVVPPIVQFGALEVVLVVLGSFGEHSLGQIAATLAVAAPTLALLRVASRATSRRSGWLALGGACTVVTVAKALDVLAGSSATRPVRMAEVLLMIAYLPLLVGLVRVAEPDPRRATVEVLDRLLLMAFVAGFLWLLVVHPLQPAASLPEFDRTMRAIWVAGDVVVLLAVARVLVHRSLRRSVGYLLAGAATMWLVAHGTSLVTSLQGARDASSTVELLSLLGYGVLGAAAVCHAAARPVLGVGHVVDHADHAGPSAPSALMLTGLALLAPVVAGVSAIERGRTAGVMAAVLWTIAVVALVVARGSVARRQEVAAQRDVRSRATIDPPTGALRREAFLEQASGRGVRDRVGTVLMIHVGFDWIPDVERPGDEVMAIMVERFHHWLSGGPLVARLGDDEFAVFVRSSDTGRGRLLGESLRAACSEPVEVGGQIVVPVLSVGVAQIDGTVIDLVAGLRRSGRALRHALESGFLRVAVDAELIGDPSVPQVGSAQR